MSFELDLFVYPRFSVRNIFLLFFSLMALRGQTVLVCGGAKNLGALVATLLAGEGANVAIHFHGSSAAKSADSLIAGFKEKYPNMNAKSYQADLSGPKDVAKLFADVLADFGKLDIVVNTVGRVLKKPLVDISESGRRFREDTPCTNESLADS